MSSASSSFELRAGALRLALVPEVGGAIAGLWHRDTPVLRSVEPSELAGPRESACYPLVPYSNRLGMRRFRWKGNEYTTQPNFEGSPHSLHGVGWRRPWRIVSSSAVEVVIRLRHDGDADWPFAFEADQYIALTPHGLNVQMLFTNRADVAQPVGLGWHPYFPKRMRSRVHVEVSARWEAEATQQLPTRKVAQPGIDSDVAHLAFDHCFDGWRGPARIRDERFSLQLTSSLHHLVVYTPPDREWFCIEPVSHVTNAIHMADPAAHGLRTVEPGASTEASMSLEVTAVL